MHFSHSKYIIHGDRSFARINPPCWRRDKLPNVMLNCVYLGKYDHFE